MGGGVSIPAEMKPIIHTQFDIKPTEDWKNGTDLETVDELRAELVRLRGLALCSVNAKNEKKRVKDAIDVTTYVKKNIEKPNEVRSLIHEAMASNSLFKRCRDVEKTELLNTFSEATFAEGVTIMKQGDQGDKFYVIQKGICEVYLDGHKKPVSSLQTGHSFGELALMYNTPRAATVIAKTDVVAWTIDRPDFRLILAHHAKLRSESNIKLLQEVKLSAEIKFIFRYSAT